MVRDVIFKFFRTIYIVVITVFTHDNIRPGNYILNIATCLIASFGYTALGFGPI